MLSSSLLPWKQVLRFFAFFPIFFSLLSMSVPPPTASLPPRPAACPPFPFPIPIYCSHLTMSQARTTHLHPPPPLYFFALQEWKARHIRVKQHPATAHKKKYVWGGGSSTAASTSLTPDPSRSNGLSEMIQTKKKDKGEEKHTFLHRLLFQLSYAQAQSAPERWMNLFIVKLYFCFFSLRSTGKDSSGSFRPHFSFQSLKAKQGSWKTWNKLTRNCN